MVNDNLERASAEDLLNHQFTKIYEDEEGTQSFNIFEVLIDFFCFNHRKIIFYQVLGCA